MKIKFHETIYDILGVINITSTHFQTSFKKGNNTFDFIINDTLNTNEITIYNDENEIQGIYTGYTSRIALYILDDNETISVEFANKDIQSLIDSLTATVTTQEVAIEDLGEATNALAEDNATQDLAIEDLAEAISELEG